MWGLAVYRQVELQDRRNPRHLIKGGISMPCSGILKSPRCQLVDFIIANLWWIHWLWLGAFPLYSSNTSALCLTNFCIWSLLTPNASPTKNSFIIISPEPLLFGLKLRFCKIYEPSWNPYTRSSFLKITMFNMSGIERMFEYVKCD